MAKFIPKKITFPAERYIIDLEWLSFFEKVGMRKLVRQRACLIHSFCLINLTSPQTQDLVSDTANVLCHSDSYIETKEGLTDAIWFLKQAWQYLGAPGQSDKLYLAQWDARVPGKTKKPHFTSISNGFIVPHDLRFVANTTKNRFSSNYQDLCSWLCWTSHAFLPDSIELDANLKHALRPILRTPDAGMIAEHIKNLTNSVRVD